MRIVLVVFIALSAVIASHSVLQQSGIHRTAYGYVLGCDQAGALSGSVFMVCLLETYDSGSLPCKFYLGRWYHDTELYQ